MDSVPKPTTTRSDLSTLSFPGMLEAEGQTFSISNNASQAVTAPNGSTAAYFYELEQP